MATVAVKKAEDGRKAREVGQLRREARRRQHQINSLQTDAKRRENVLKRRQEEVGVVRDEIGVVILSLFRW